MKNEEILRKIQALLGRTTDNGCTEAEAESASRAVQRLLMTYNISEEDVLKSSEDKDNAHKVGRTISPVKWRHQGQHDWMVPLAKMVAKTSCCDVLFSKRTGRNDWSYHWIGTEVNRKVAEDIFDWITGQMYDLACKSRTEAYHLRNIGEGPKYLGRNFLRTYLYSMSLRVSERLWNSFKELVTEIGADQYLLMRTNDNELFVQELKPNSKTMTTNNGKDSALGRAAGQRDADKVRLNKQEALKPDLGPKALGGKK